MFRKLAISIVALLISLLAGDVSSAADSCNGTQAISGNYTFGSDYEQTSGSADCFSITGTAVIDLNGHTITCAQGGGCTGKAIAVSADNVTIKNGTIAGPWNYGIFNGVSGATAYDLTVFNMVITGPSTGLFFPGDSTRKNVFINDTACIATFIVAMPEGGEILENYCDSGGTGIQANGPSSGTTADIRRNYIRTGDYGINFHSGIGTIRQNIIVEATDPILIGVGATETVTQNLCDDVLCDQPDAAPFSLTLDW